MIKQLLFSIFLIYPLSANKVLLQWVPPTIPTQPVIPIPIPPIPFDPAPPIPPVSHPWPHVPTTPHLPSFPVATPPATSTIGAFGQTCPIPTAPAQCQSNTDILTDAGIGKIQCSASADCCMCAGIECGYLGEVCRALRFGPSAAFGVQNIKSVGAQTGVGTFITCQGVESCANAMIRSEYVAEIECNGADSCANAVMFVDNPSVGFALDCAGQNSCAGLAISITIDAPLEGCPVTASAAAQLFDFSGVECLGENSCVGLQISVTNNGCAPVLIEDINCVAANSCQDAVFSFIGDIDVQNCQCGPSCDSAIGLEKCFSSIAEVVCPDPLSCMGRHEIINNPVNGFEMVCGALQSCENANFMFELVPDVGMRGITVWEGLYFSGVNSGRGAVFTVANRQGNDANGVPIVLTIEEIDCDAVGSCEGMTVVIGENVIIGTFICSADACVGCTVNGVACDVNQAQITPPLIEPVPLPVNIQPVIPQPAIPQPV